MMLQLLYLYGIVLNLDINNFQNIEMFIDEWITVIKIAIIIMGLDEENFI